MYIHEILQSKKVDVDMTDKVVYICSPYSGDVARNKQYARELTKFAIECNLIPITPHLYLTEALDDRIPEQRELGLTVGLKLLDSCNALLFGSDYGISKGMQGEISKARVLGLPIYAAVKVSEIINGKYTRYLKQLNISDGLEGGNV